MEKVLEIYEGLISFIMDNREEIYNHYIDENGNKIDNENKLNSKLSEKINEFKDINNDKKYFINTGLGGKSGKTYRCDFLFKERIFIEVKIHENKIKDVYEIRNGILSQLKTFIRYWRRRKDKKVRGLLLVITEDCQNILNRDFDLLIDLFDEISRNLVDGIIVVDKKEVNCFVETKYSVLGLGDVFRKHYLLNREKFEK